MARNKYGIIDFGKFEFRLDNAFNTQSDESIEEILTDKQKLILDDVNKNDFSKLVYGEIKITDSNSLQVFYKGLLHISNGSLSIVEFNDDDTITQIRIYKAINDYKIYS